MLATDALHIVRLPARKHKLKCETFHAAFSDLEKLSTEFHMKFLGRLIENTAFPKSMPVESRRFTKKQEATGVTK